MDTLHSSATVEIPKLKGIRRINDFLSGILNMAVSILFKTVRFLKEPVVLAIGLLLLSGLLFINKESLTSHIGSPEKEARKALQELISLDPQAADIIQRIEDERLTQGLLIAAHSANADNRRRSTLADMAAEAVEVRGIPYRARLASLSLTDLNFNKSEEREAFFTSHGTACELLEAAAGWSATADYMTLLEQARLKPLVWPIVRDDPLALIIWSETDDPESLQFYHRNRDWLADPLAGLDLSGVDGGWTIHSAITRLRKYEESLRLAVEDGGLGVYGISIILTHGLLIDICRTEYSLHPAETISVIYMNPDMLLEQEGDVDWIGGKAAWLAQIEMQHPIVWFAAGMSPFALRLHRDSPNVSDSILEKYGADDVSVLIYQHFSESEQVAAAANAIEVFGDLAIYVFAKYEDPIFIRRLGKYMTDSVIGIRVIPFVFRFGDEAFDRIEDDFDWVDRYFLLDGRPREDDLEWIQYLPGGSIVQVASNWAKGYPCEYSELGWAAFDVAEMALMVVSFGTSKTVTTTAKAGAKGAKAMSVGVRRTEVLAIGARGTRVSEWSRGLAAFRKTTISLGCRMPRLMQVAGSVAKNVRLMGKPIWATIKLSNATARIAWRGARGTLKAWKSLSPPIKRCIYSGVLGGTLFITLTHRTLPNVEKIGIGIGEFIGKAAAGTITMAGSAIAKSAQSFAESLMGGSTTARIAAYWLVLSVTLIGTVFLFIRGIRNRSTIVISGA
jgi:hypothetical protein